MLLALALPCALVVQDPAPRVRIANPTPVRREEVVRFAMPWPEGRLRELAAVRVGDTEAPCAVLERWRDGSVALVQVHARVALQPGADVVLTVEPLDREPAFAEREFAFDGRLPFRCELEDPWGRTFEASLEPDPAGAIEAWGTTASVRLSRFRGLHARRASDGVVEAFLPVAAWLVDFAGERRAELTILLDADPREGEPVLGPVRFRSFALRCDDPDVRALPRFRDAMSLPSPEPLPGGGFRQRLLGPNGALYLGDRTGKAFRIDLFRDGDDVDVATRDAARLAVEQPLLALPDVDWVRSTRAFGAHGGPAPPSQREASLARAAAIAWRFGGDGGPFGGFGDPRDLTVAGALRGGPSVLHDVLRGGGLGIWKLAELSAMQQTLRPTPATSPRLPDVGAPLRQGLGERSIDRPQGFAALDYEHFSVDLLHDVYWLGGDPLARRELARAGGGLLPLLRTVPFRTSRGEGLCLQAGVLIARATDDQGLLGALHARFRDALLEEIGDDTAIRAHAIAQPPHADALGPDHPFDSPWQMAILVHGLHALWRATADDEVRSAAVRVAERLAGPCWIEGAGPAGFVSARDPNVRSRALVGDRASGMILVSAFVLAGEMAGSEVDRRRFRERADALIGGERGAAEPGDSTGPWRQLYLDRNSTIR